MTQNSATGCQQWSLLSAVLSSRPLVSAGPLVSALAVYLWWKLVRRLTAWIVQWQRRRRYDFLATVSGSTRCRVLSSSSIVFHVKRRKKRKRWKLWSYPPSAYYCYSWFICLSLFTSDYLFDSFLFIRLGRLQKFNTKFIFFPLSPISIFDWFIISSYTTV